MPEPETVHLTPEELVRRWRGRVSIKTLRNWRSGRFKTGPGFIRLWEPNGKVIYPIEEVEKYEQRNSLISTREKR
jgi:hypothetical protein